MITYRLSNIARSIRYNKETYNIIYSPHGSVLDSIFYSIKHLKLITNDEKSLLGTDCIVTYENLSPELNKTSKHYHNNILYISTDEQKTDLNHDTFYLNKDTYGIPQPQNIDLSHRTKPLLYIRDRSQTNFNMISKFLESQNIKYEVVVPEVFYNRDIQEIYQLFSQYRSVLGNDNEISLLVAYRSGCLPITFKNILAKNKYISLVEEHNILDLIYSERTQDSMLDFDALYDFDKFVNTFTNHLNQVISRPFII